MWPQPRLVKLRGVSKDFRSEGIWQEMQAQVKGEFRGKVKTQVLWERSCQKGSFGKSHCLTPHFSSASSSFFPLERKNVPS